MSGTDSGKPRRIRSFVRRPGRRTPAQRRALAELWPRYGLDAGNQLDYERVFGRLAKRRVLEIGYGNGDSLAALAAADPEADIVGIEVHEPGIGHCLLAVEAAELANVRLVAADAIDVLRTRVADAELTRLNLYFPDPWPKKRHHKRRIVNDAFLALAARVLADDGRLHLATDWAPYAEHIDECIARSPDFRVRLAKTHDGSDPPERARTKFEQRGLALGHEIRDWILVRKPRRG